MVARLVYLVDGQEIELEKMSLDSLDSLTYNAFGSEDEIIDSPRYEKIFDNGTTSETKDLKRFMGKENKLVLKIRTKDANDDYMVPVISATKEVK